MDDLDFWLGFGVARESGPGSGQRFMSRLGSAEVFLQNVDVAAWRQASGFVPSSWCYVQRTA